MCATFDEALYSHSQDGLMVHISSNLETEKNLTKRPSLALYCGLKGIVKVTASSHIMMLHTTHKSSHKVHVTDVRRGTWSGRGSVIMMYCFLTWLQQ